MDRGTFDAFDSELGVGGNNVDFMEKRVFGRNFVVNFWNIFYDNELAGLGDLCASNGNWYFELVGGES